MTLNDAAGKLKRVIEQAIEDQVITMAEYKDILDQATEDGVIDPQERVLLGQLQEMIANKTLKLVP